MDASQGKRANHLIKEKSPYLLEHAFNPVDWYPWGEEAFEKARKENIPIFLSIGYSACHWCHVFRRESLEDPEIAKILNDQFVSIKVDREERPDVDEIYMRAVMSMTGSGGWPLNLFLTPQLEPFYGGTYFPPYPKNGMPGFANILKGISQAWKSDRENITRSAEQMRTNLQDLSSQETTEIVDESVFDKCFSELASEYDQTYGGFGRAPKFPVVSNLLFLLRYHDRTKTGASLNMVTKTLDAIASGGIHDQIGGGFHRYSTDREWLVPHFEKMLYDNALLTIAFTEAYQVTRKDMYKAIVEETIGWILREMTSDEGGFFSSQDADISEGEGAYYLWDLDELQFLPETERKLVTSYFGMDRPNFQGKVIPTASSIEEISRILSLSSSDASIKLAQAKRLLLSARMRKERPATDDKILTSWNGLMISALSRAHQVFEDQNFLKQAQESADFILRKLVERDSEGKITKLFHRYREGETKGDGLLEDYAYLLNGLIDLYESCFEFRYLVAAVQISNSMVDLFSDEIGGFFCASKEASDLIARSKTAYDGAMPSPNSVAVLALSRLGELTGNEGYQNRAKSAVQFFSSQLSSQPSSFTFMIVALDFMQNTKEIVLSGELSSENMIEMLRFLRQCYLPSKVLIAAAPEVLSQSTLVEGRISGPNSFPQVFVCSNNMCKLPSKNVTELAKALREK